MINEILKVEEEILSGEHINKDALYGTIYLVSKYYKEKGLSYVEIRNKIFDWGKENNIFFDFQTSPIIHRAMDDNVPLRGSDTVIYINDNDISEITRRFDRKAYRRTALAMLCYAKAVADRNNRFYLSMTQMGFWLGYPKTNMSNRYIKALTDFAYVKKLNNNKKWVLGKKVVPNKSKCLQIEILVPTENYGDYMLVNNDIDGLYSEIFEKKNHNI